MRTLPRSVGAVLLVVLALLALRRGGAQETPGIERVRLKPVPEVRVSAENASLRRVLGDVGREAGVTILFDESFRDKNVTVELGEVGAADALEKLTLVNRLFYKVLDPETVIVVPDNAQTRRQYDDMVLQTFHIRHADVNVVANMFRTIAAIQRVQPNPGERSISVRATPDQVAVAQRILDQNDGARGELAVRIDVVAVDGEAASSDNVDARDVLVSQTVRLAEHARARVSVRSGGSVETVTEEVGEDRVLRPVGIDLGLTPVVSSEGIVEIAVELAATAAGDVAGAAGRLRDASTVMRLAEGERAALGTMFRVRELAGVFSEASAAQSDRHVAVVVSATILRQPAAREASQPTFMGTEQHIRVR